MDPQPNDRSVAPAGAGEGAADGTRDARPWPVMVLAHNEEANIVACLDSLFASDPGRALEIYVMANGCTDATEQVVRHYAGRRPGVHLVCIELGDKCNAWNEFVHETARSVCPDREVYFFANGDARAVPGSLGALAAGLERNPYANAASAPPASGRSLARDRRKLLEGRHLVANLYALRGDFVRRLQQEQARLPLGLEGDDGLIGALVKWDLDPTGAFDDQRIEPCADAGFVFESMSHLRPRDWVGYWKRMVRYGRRRYEYKLLGKRLAADGLAVMPRHIRELYVHADELELSWEGIHTLANWVALREMRRH